MILDDWDLLIYLAVFGLISLFCGLESFKIEYQCSLSHLSGLPLIYFIYQTGSVVGLIGFVVLMIKVSKMDNNNL